MVDLQIDASLIDLPLSGSTGGSHVGTESKEEAMELIRVRYNNDSFDYVRKVDLHEMIQRGQIKHFLRRKEGWVTVGLNPTRTGTAGVYRGPERRKRSE